MRSIRWVLAVWVLVGLVACGPPPAAEDAAGPGAAADAGGTGDAVVDASDGGGVGPDSTPAGPDAADALSPDAALPDAAAADAAADSSEPLDVTPVDVAALDVTPVDVAALDVAPPDGAAQDAGDAAEDAAMPDSSDAGPPVCVPLGPAAGPAAGTGCLDARGCAPGLGCHGGACGACTAAAECRDFDGCRPDGTCGRCEDDGHCRAQEHCASGFCAPSALPHWELGVAPEDWATFWANPYQKNLVPCTLVVDGVPYEGCHIRLRGGSSLDFPKRSFRVEIDDGLPSPGYASKINLRAEYNDPSYLRNLLATQLFARASRLPVPRVRFVTVALNGEPYGLMAEVERVSDPMLAAHGWAKDVPLVEADPPLEISKLGAGALVPLAPQAVYGMAFDAKGNGAKDALAALIGLVEDVIWPDHLDRLAGAPHPVRVGGAVATDLLVDTIALHALLQGRDHVRKNYYLSLQPWPGEAASRWAMLPWDLDLTFGCTWTAEHETVCKEMTVDLPWEAGAVPDGVPVGYPVQGQYNLLLDLVIQDPLWREQIRGRVCALIDDPVWTTDIPDLSAALEDAIAPAVELDPHDRVEQIGTFHAAVDGVREFVELRRAFLREALDCASCP